METRVYNFSPGPAAMPLEVLQHAQSELLALPGLGISPLEISHRSPWFDGVMDETRANLRSLMGIPDNYQILFMQGGSRLQFSMIPANLLRGSGKSADYIITGTWGKTALPEAEKEGPTRVAFNSKDTNFDRLPKAGELKLDKNAAYAHFTSNETIQGVQFPVEPDVGDVPLVCDASSDFMCRPIDVSKYGLIYACAQKNAGPAGVTIVIIRDDLLERSSDDLPTMLNYKEYAAQQSLLNTPPVFAIYLVMLITRWLKDDIGGLDKMLEINKRKAQSLYDVISGSDGFYTGHAQPECRSLMNVTFRLPDDETQSRFLAEAKKRSLVELKGHRSVGGIRASIYNAMPEAGVEALRDCMVEFQKSSK